MNNSVIIISFFILGAFIIPFIYYSYSIGTKKKKYIQLLNQLAEKNHCKIAEYEVLKNSCIGIDNDNKFVFHVKKNGENSVDTVINLKEVQKCKITGLNYQSNGKSNSHKPIENIGLSFTYRDTLIPETSLEFFNSETYYTANQEDIKLAEKWHKMVNSKISSN